MPYRVRHPDRQTGAAPRVITTLRPHHHTGTARNRYPSEVADVVECQVGMNKRQDSCFGILHPIRSFVHWNDSPHLQKRQACIVGMFLDYLGCVHSSAFHSPIRRDGDIYKFARIVTINAEILLCILCPQAASLGLAPQSRPIHSSSASDSISRSSTSAWSFSPSNSVPETPSPLVRSFPPSVLPFFRLLAFCPSR